MNERKYCTLRVDELVLGIPIERVEEVLRDETIIPVPHAHPDVAGLLNLRGNIVTAIDARRRLGLPHRHCENPTIVVIRSAGELVTLLVDSVGDIVDIDEDGSQELPETVNASITALVTGAYEQGDHLLLALDPDRVLAVAS